MIEDPKDYRWSSCPAKVGITEQSWLDFDPFYLRLGDTAIERATKYDTWLKGTIPDGGCFYQRFCAGYHNEHCRLAV